MADLVVVLADDVGPAPMVLARIDRVRAALAEVRTLADAGAILDDLERLRRYARAAKWTLDAQNEIARGWFETQRKAGEVLAEMDKNAGGPPVRKSVTDSRTESVTERPPRLADLGITPKQSMNWQAYARIPEVEFREVLERIAEVRRLTTSSVLRYFDLLKAVGLTVVPAEPGAARVHAVDYRDLLGQIDNESVDLLLTDPPYSTDIEDVGAFAREWLALALPKVKPSGRAYVCIGAYPAELYAYLDALLGQRHLTMEQVLVWTYRNTLGPRPTHGYMPNWQAILYLSGPDAPPLACPSMLEQFAVMDVTAPDGRHGTRLHGWQKPDALAERLVRHAAPADGVVLDPFAGTGTFLAAASRFGCRAVGSEIDPSMLAWCEERGIEVQHASG